MLRTLANCFLHLSSRLKRRWLVLATMLAVASLAELAAAIALYRFLGGETETIGFDAESSGAMSTPFALVIVIFVGKSLLGIAASAMRARLVADSTQSIFSALIRRDIAREPSDSASSSAQQIWRAMEVSDIAFRIVASAGVSIAAEVLAVVALVAAMIWVAPLAAFGATIVIGAVCAILLIGTRGITSRVGAESHRRSGSLAAAMHSVFGVRREVRSKRREDRFADILSAVHLERVRPLQKHLFLLSFPRHVIELSFVTVLVAVVILIGTAESREEFVALLGVFAYAGFRLVPAANRILFSVDEIRHQHEAIEELDSSLSTPPAPRIVAGKEPLEMIVLSDVSHRYPDAERNALERIELTIEPGERVGLLGRSGSGKSTLINLIGGILEPNDGSITIGEKTAAAWLEDGGRLGFVPQGSLLLDESIRENIAFGHPAEEETLQQSIETVKLLEMIDSLPDGLDTPVGERGMRISGGERQRITIARAIADSPDLLLLDEATSALDEPTEREILENLDRNPNLTIVIAAHRMRSLAICNRLIVLSHGRIVAEGSPAEISAHSPEFRRLTER